LRALRRAFFGEQTSAAAISTPLAPITLAEKCGAGILMLSTLAIGVYPKFLLDRIMPAVEAMSFLKP
jgi:NADH:ubiquinone oxidoreductase subunit 4 (subunit M)